MLFGEAGNALHPLFRSSVEAAFALNGLEDERGRRVEAGRRVLKHHLDLVERVDIVAESAGIRKVGGAVQAAATQASACTFASITGQREGAERHAVEAVGEGDNIAATGDLAGQLYSRLDGVRAGRAGHHDLVVLHATRREDVLFERCEPVGLRVGVHVEAVGHAVARDVLDQGGFHVRIVVAVIQRRTAGKKVDIGLAGCVSHFRAGGLDEQGVEVAAIAADLRFPSFENVVLDVGDICERHTFGSCVVWCDDERRPGLMSGAGRQLEWANGHEDFTVVTAFEVAVLVKERALFEWSIQPAGDAPEQAPGGLIIRRDRRLQVFDGRAGRS